MYICMCIRICIIYICMYLCIGRFRLSENVENEQCASLKPGAIRYTVPYYVFRVIRYKNADCIEDIPWWCETSLVVTL